MSFRIKSSMLVLLILAYVHPKKHIHQTVGKHNRKQRLTSLDFPPSTQSLPAKIPKAFPMGNEGSVARFWIKSCLGRSLLIEHSKQSRSSWWLSHSLWKICCQIGSCNPKRWTKHIFGQPPGDEFDIFLLPTSNINYRLWVFPCTNVTMKFTRRWLKLVTNPGTVTSNTYYIFVGSVIWWLVGEGNKLSFGKNIQFKCVRIAHSKGCFCRCHESWIKKNKLPYGKLT